MRNAEFGTGNGEGEMGDDKWRMADDKCRMGLTNAATKRATHVSRVPESGWHLPLGWHLALSSRSTAAVHSTAQLLSCSREAPAGSITKKKFKQREEEAIYGAF